MEGRARAASSSSISPSPPSDGGEGWGEEARFYSPLLGPLPTRSSRGEDGELDFSLSSIGWRRGQGRGGAFLLVTPLLGPLPTRSSRGEDGELDAALPPAAAESRMRSAYLPPFQL